MNKDEFYVGYFPMPKTYKKFLFVILTIIAIFFTILVFIVAKEQVQPKNGVGWNPNGDGAIIVKGVISKFPYDLLRFKESKKSAVQTAILTSMTKTSIQNRIKGKYDKALDLKGVMIRQNGRFVFSVLDGKESIKISDFNPLDFSPLKTKMIGIVHLQGEIIDPKCYLGAMKPGGGKVHKSCAVLCIRGGIPPMFVTKNELLNETYYLLTDKNGGPIVEDIIAYVGDPVSITGFAEKHDDMLFLRLDVESIKRL